jgi:hypothetical protein
MHERRCPQTASKNEGCAKSIAAVPRLIATVDLTISSYCCSIRFPVDRACECASEIRIMRHSSFFRQIEPLVLDSFQSGHKPHRTEQMTEGEGHF